MLSITSRCKVHLEVSQQSNIGLFLVGKGPIQIFTLRPASKLLSCMTRWSIPVIECTSSVPWWGRVRSWKQNGGTWNFWKTHQKAWRLNNRNKRACEWGVHFFWDLRDLRNVQLVPLGRYPHLRIVGRHERSGKCPSEPNESPMVTLHVTGTSLATCHWCLKKEN